MRYLCLLFLTVCVASSAESVFSDATSGLRLRIPFAEKDKVVGGMDNDDLTLATYAGRLDSGIASMVIMIMKKGADDSDLDEHVAKLKEGMKTTGEVGDITGNIPPVLGKGFTLTTTGGGVNAIYISRQKGCETTITLRGNNKEALLGLQAWLYERNK